MNTKLILNALEQIEEADDDCGEINNAIAVIRCEVNKAPALDPERFFAQKFEAGKSYIVFLENGAVDPAALQSTEPVDYDLMFVFVHSDGRPVADKFLVAGKGARIFADSRYVEEMDGVTLVDPGYRTLGEVVMEVKS